MKILLIINFLISNVLQAESEIVLLYSAANPDYKPFESTFGIAISGEWAFNNGLFLSGYHSNTNFKPGGPDAGGATVKSWTEIGLGYSFHSQWGDFYSLLTLENIEAINKTFKGYGAHFGYRNNFADDWSALLQLGYIDTEFKDWQLVAKLQYDVTKNIGLTLRLRDYDKWDHTIYEAGIVFKF